MLFRHQHACPDGPEPLGVVMPQGCEDPSLANRGRVVFAPPVLLPEEQFLPLDMLLGRELRFQGGRRSRLQIPRPGR